MKNVGPFSTRFKVGKKIVCTLTFANGVLKAEWDEIPHRLKQREWEDYRAGRDALLAEVAKALGATVMCAEPHSDKMHVNYIQPDSVTRAKGEA